jgi:hypothetical protein
VGRVGGRRKGRIRIKVGERMGSGEMKATIVIYETSRDLGSNMRLQAATAKLILKKQPNSLQTKEGINHTKSLENA